MLSCIYNNEDFNNKQEGYCEKKIRELGLSKQLFCPKCNAPVYFCAEGKITSHFKHFGKTCENSHLYKYDLNSERHFKATEFIYDWIKAQYPNTKIVKDKYLLNGETDQKADLYFETNMAKIVIELQFRHINFTDLLERRKFYKLLGIKDIWIFVQNDLYRPGTPYERYYYRDNNRELYFYEDHTRKFTYYKGLKTEKFTDGPLIRYANNSTALDVVNINPEGYLELPLLREKYFEKIAQIREQLHKKVPFKKLITVNRTTQHIEPKKMKTESHTFHNIQFYNKNGISMATVQYINDDGELLTEVFTYKTKNESKNEINMICHKPDNSNVTYDINIINSPLYKKIRISSFSL